MRKALQKQGKRDREIKYTKMNLHSKRDPNNDH